MQLDDLARNYEFSFPLVFESADYDFRFGDHRILFFVPCYSEQNGYYTDEVDIYYNGECKLSLAAEIID